MDSKHETNIHENEHFAPEYRDRLRTWLVKMIDSDTIPGLCWENEEKTIFRMPWKHAGRQDYNLEEDSKIFMAWAKHSGRYREGIDRPEPIVWKTRLRCALNKMQDIKEIPSRSRLDISEPYRVYQLLPPIHKASQIRRRFYHRSHSHDVIPNQASDHQTAQNGTNWNKKTSDPGLVDEKSYLAAKSSLLSGVSAVPPPGFWFAPSVKMPLNAPMSSELLTQTSSASVDAISQLRSFAHGRYPLMTSLQSPFMPFPPTTLPSLFPTTSTNFEALKQLALNNQSPVNGYVDRVRAHDEEKERQEHFKILSHNAADASESFSNSISSETKNVSRHNSVEREDNKDVSTYNDKNLRHSPEIHPLYVRLGEFQRRIETLEQDLKNSQSAHAQEREAREQLELEKETMQARLTRMSEGLRVLATHIHQPDEYVTPNTTLYRNGKISTMLNAKKFAAFQQTLGTRSPSPIKREILSPVDTQASAKLNRALSTISRARRPSAQNTQRRPTVSNENGKRCASPLDLTVPSPKKPNVSEDEKENPGNSVSKQSPSPSNGLLISSSPIRSLSSDDKRIFSPYSTSSESPESVGRSRSLSPISGAYLLQPHQQLRQVQVS